jgi:ubiquinone/menaquinone biosynthesis C-methylase UbiE
MKKIKMLDIGGRASFWNNMQLGNYMDLLDITIVNIEENRDLDEQFKYISADARKLPFADDSFDVVFSNSVIEHIEGDDGVTFNEQQEMADEMLRVGKQFYVQTPNYWFPIEPHFLFPFFQYLPITIKTFLLRNFNLGWYKKIENKGESIRIAKSIRLLTSKEMNSLFPHSNTYKENFFGFTKSITKYSKI